MNCKEDIFVGLKNAGSELWEDFNDCRRSRHILWRWLDNFLGKFSLSKDLQDKNHGKSAAFGDVIVQGDKWQCGACGMINADKFDRCICGHERVK